MLDYILVMLGGALGTGALSASSLGLRRFVLCCLDRSRSGTLDLAATANLRSFPPDHLRKAGSRLIEIAKQRPVHLPHILG